MQQVHNNLRRSGNGAFKRTLAAAEMPFSNKWTNMMPSSYDYRMPLGAFQKALRFRLQLPVVSSAGPCDTCKEWADSMGIHTSTCSGMHKRRHDSIRDALYEEIKRAGMAADREPLHLVREDGRRSDILIYDYRGQNTCLDITVVSSFRGNECFLPGANVRAAEKRKQDKYMTDLGKEGYHFVPFAMETIGGFGDMALEVMRVLGRNTRDLTQQTAAKATARIRNRLQFKWQRALGIALLARARHVDHPGDEVF